MSARPGALRARLADTRARLGAAALAAVIAVAAAVGFGLFQLSKVFPSPDEGRELAEDSELPTGEQIGAEFERFLAGLDDQDGH